MNVKASVLLIHICFLLIAIVRTNVLRKKAAPETESELDRKVADTLEEEEEGVILDRSRIFQDIFSAHLAPFEIQFGHVCENPNHWEQRFEHRDYENNHHKGKVKWGDKAGGYGEMYWDLNH